VNKPKYVGCYFAQNNCKIDISSGVRTFFGNFNNIMAVARLNEMATVHLIKAYCLPSVTYGCEVWSLRSAEYQKLNVTFNRDNIQLQLA